MMPRTGAAHLNLKALDFIRPAQQLLEFTLRARTSATRRQSLSKDIGHEPQLFDFANGTVRLGRSADVVAGGSKEIRMGIAELIEHLEAPAIFSQQDLFAQPVFQAPAEVFAPTSPKPRTLLRHGRRLVARRNI
jgi:hypothetical protein